MICLDKVLPEVPNQSLLRPAVAGTQSLGRALGLLRILVTRPHQGWRISDLAQASGQDITTAHRLLTGLVQEGLVEQRPSDKHYLPGPRLFEFSLARSNQHELLRYTEGVLTKLAREQVGTLLFLIRSDTDFVCSVHLNLSGRASATMLYAGARRAMTTSAGGVAILQKLPECEFMRVLNDNLAHEQIRHGSSRLDALQKMFDLSHQHGFGINLGFLVPGSHAFALPVLDANGDVYGSVCLIGAAEDYPLSSIARVREFLTPAVQTLQVALRNSASSTSKE